MTPARIISSTPRLDMLRRLRPGGCPDACSCGLIRLGGAAERAVGSVTHGILVCYQEGKP